MITQSYPFSNLSPQQPPYIILWRKTNINLARIGFSHISGFYMEFIHALCWRDNRNLLARLCLYTHFYKRHSQRFKLISAPSLHQHTQTSAWSVNETVHIEETKTRFWIISWNPRETQAGNGCVCVANVFVLCDVSNPLNPKQTMGNTRDTRWYHMK